MNKTRNSASIWQRFYKRNSYYHKDLEFLAKHLIPSDVSVLEIGCRGGEIISCLPNKVKVGVDWDDSLLALARKRSKKGTFIPLTEMKRRLKGKTFDYILISHAFSYIADVQKFIELLRDFSHSDTRIIVVYFNFLWKPVLDLSENLGLKLPSYKEPNWLTGTDTDNLLSLESFEKIGPGSRFLFPFYFPLISEFINRVICQLPGINSLCLTHYSIYRPTPTAKDYSVSIVIPARNEAGNIQGILEKIPTLGTKTEVVFVEGGSKDNTWETIKKEVEDYRGELSIQAFRQGSPKGKGNAVRVGFSRAKNELLMILDADLTVGPDELVKFYEAASLGKGEFIIGSRLVYPMEKQAMRILNYFGNKFFSVAFSFLLGQRIKDTLCGTKVILSRNYQKIVKNRHLFGDFDPFGDFDLIFGSAKLNLKIIEIPIRYKERTYGKTNISRFAHGLLLLKMVAFAAKKLKFV